MKRRYIFILLLVMIVGGIFFVVSEPNSERDKTVNSNYKKPASDLRDVHGIAVDLKDSTKLWIANHSGLYVLENDKDLFAVGSKRDDYMGFLQHPTEPNTFYTSGHSTGGGNIGFQKTTDGGQTWQKISDGINGPVDFHTMAVSKVEPSIVYGSYHGVLQKSTDGGNSWVIITNAPQAIALTTSPTSKDTVYAATQNGLQVSIDQGTNWKVLGLEGVVLGVSVSPADANEMLASTQNQGLMKTIDGGITWQAVTTNTAQDIVFIAYDKNNPEAIYTITQDTSISKSTDGGTSWQKIR